MASLASLRTVMWATVLITLFIFGMFILAVSALFSMAESVNLSLYSTLLVAAGLAIIFMLIQLAISPAIVRASTHLRYIESGEFPWLERTVENLSEKSGVKKPRIAISPNNDPNAFVFGNSSSNMTLAIHQGLLNSLSEEEITGVIGHELGHIRHKDALIMTVLSALPLMAYMVATATMSLGGGGGRRRGEADILSWQELLL